MSNEITDIIKDFNFQIDEQKSLILKLKEDLPDWKIVRHLELEEALNHLKVLLVRKAIVELNNISKNNA